MNPEVQCPLCTQIGFQSVDALRTALVSAASRNLICPVCNACLTGLDKLTVHLFSHTLPHHDLQNVGQSVSINNDSPVITPTEPEKVNLTSEESSKKPEISPPCSIPVENFENFQNESVPPRVSDATSLLNHDLSSLLCWLPLTCFPDKSLNSAASAVSSAHCDVVNSGTALHQESDGKGGIAQLLGTAENNCANKDTPFIIVGLPSLQDVKKEVPISNSSTNELSLSDVTSLSGKLLMLDCSGNSQCNSNIGVTTSSELSSVQISTPHQSIPHTISLNVLPPNPNTSLSNRDLTNTSTSSNTDDNIQHSKQCDESSKLSDKVHRCSLCFLQFTDSSILSLHQQLVHEGSDSLQSKLTSFEKEPSSNQAKSNSDPAEVKQEENFQCHLCSKTFQMQGSLMVHLRVAHATPTMVGLASRIKGSMLDSAPAASASSPGAAPVKNAKEQAQGKNADNKQWECSDCGKFFTTKYFLKKHKRLHTGEMPYSCPTCGKCFTFQQSYHKHLLYHSDEKPHTCTECGRSFKELSTLHNHQRIHTGEKPWACETCGKCFRQRVSYLVHRRIHTGAMPYCCTVCNKSFRYKVSQRTHKCNAQSAGASTRQSGDLLQRLLFDQPEETCSEQNQEREEGKLENEEQTQFIRQIQSQPEEVGSQSKQPCNESPQGTQLLYSAVNKDKPIFAQRSETGSSDFSLHNFELQQSLSNTQSEVASPSNAMLSDVSSLLKDQLKQNIVIEKNNSTWCIDKQGSPLQNTSVNPSLVVMVNDKEVTSAGAPIPNVPVSLLQILKKERYSNEFSSHPSGGANNLLPNVPCPDGVKISNPVMSTPFVPDFLSMAMSTPSQNPTPMTGFGTSNVPINSDPFHWDVSLDMQNHAHNDSINDNVSTSQDTLESIQRLLFGSPSAQL